MGAVLFVSYSGTLGGAERVLLDCAAAIGDTAVLACPEGPLAQTARTADIPVLPLARRPLEVRGGGARTGLRALAALGGHAVTIRALARDVDPALVVGWGMRSALACVALPRARPTAVSHHDVLPGPPIGGAVRWAARRAAVLIANSAAVASELGTEATIVFPGVDVDRHRAGIAPAAPPHVLVLGALTAWKRPDLALEIIARARRTLPELRVRVVGGPITDADRVLRESLRRRATAPDLAGAVDLVGAVADPRPELERAACLLHCADREPFGLALVEALAAERPVVAPAAGGPLEIVDPSCARLYPPGDVTAGAAALVELVADPKRARAAGVAGRARVARRFSSAATREAFRTAVAPWLRAADGRAQRRSGELTLVTVTHDSAAVLPALLASAARHLPAAPVIVVDTASADASVALARAAGARVVALADNVGFGRACNRGLAEVTTPVAALVNPDVELIDDSLEALAAEALAPGGRRLLAPLVLNGDGTRQDTAHPAPGSPADLIATLVPPAAVPGRLGVALAPWRAPRPRPVGWAVGCALVARTATLRELGPFDASIFLYGEDLELGLRARRRGVQTWFWPQARVVHHGAHATRAAFGSEPFELRARARHEAVARAAGERRARADDRAQRLTFASRVAYKRALGRSAARERRQLAAVAALRLSR